MESEVSSSTSSSSPLPSSSPAGTSTSSSPPSSCCMEAASALSTNHMGRMTPVSLLYENVWLFLAPPCSLVLLTNPKQGSIVRGSGWGGLGSYEAQKCCWFSRVVWSVTGYSFSSSPSVDESEEVENNDEEAGETGTRRSCVAFFSEALRTYGLLVLRE